MPTYTFRCIACKHEFDVFRKKAEHVGADCPECGQAAKRVFHPVGIIFKGSGFYTTDYARKKTEPAAKKTVPAKVTAEEKSQKPSEKSEDGTAKVGTTS